MSQKKETTCPNPNPSCTALTGTLLSNNLMLILLLQIPICAYDNSEQEIPKSLYMDQNAYICYKTFSTNNINANHASCGLLIILLIEFKHQL